MAFRDPSLCSKAPHWSASTDPLTINHQLQIQRKTSAVPSIMEGKNEEHCWRQEGPDSTPGCSAFCTSALGVFNSTSAEMERCSRHLEAHGCPLLPKQVFIVQPINKCLMRPSMGTRTKHKYKSVRHTSCQFEAHNLNISQDLIAWFKNQASNVLKLDGKFI